MPEPFVPHKQEEMVLVKISKKEAILLQKLRHYAFGQFTVHKANGVLVRVQITDSQMIDDSTEVNL